MELGGLVVWQRGRLVTKAFDPATCDIGASCQATSTEPTGQGAGSVGRADARIGVASIQPSDLAHTTWPPNNRMKADKANARGLDQSKWMNGRHMGLPQHRRRR